jgi:hypothetical protein
LVPQTSSEPYRNVKNNGLLIDLESGIGFEEKKVTSPQFDRNEAPYKQEVDIDD